MKKMVYIVMPVLIVLALFVSISCVIFVYGQQSQEPAVEPKGITILDTQGNALICAKSKAEIYETDYWAYLEIVLTEAVEIIAQQEGCTESEAKNLLFTQGYQVHTAFNSIAFDALKAVDTRWGTICNTACAITDLDGYLLAVYSNDVDGKQVNYTQERRSPYSSFKALSVYTPAVEKGIANWSTMYWDAPYKQLKDENGKMQDWPANATGTYTQKNIPVYEALRKSLNTVAVKCLADVGIRESIAFLQTSFGIPLAEEEYVVKTYGEEEVIGNIALGYLETGITPVEMAGYYQIFANGGVYTQPTCVNTVSREDGTVLYTQQVTRNQVISAGAADTMNKLLQGVVAAGGTGEAAKCRDVEIAGKTGTGDDYADNWFVGVTPGYSLAVWHGQSDSNQADEMFAAVIQRLYSAQPKANRKFITHKNLYQIAYCVHSGKAFSPDCTLIDIGYFASKDALPECDVCHKK